MIQVRRIGLAIDAVGAYARDYLAAKIRVCRGRSALADCRTSANELRHNALLSKRGEVDGIIGMFDEAFENEILAAKVPATNRL